MIKLEIQELENKKQKMKNKKAFSYYIFWTKEPHGRLSNIMPDVEKKRLMAEQISISQSLAALEKKITVPRITSLIGDTVMIENKK